MGRTMTVTWNSRRHGSHRATAEHSVPAHTFDCTTGARSAPQSGQVNGSR